MARWFRMYDEVLDDPKTQRLEPALFKSWVNLLCLASKHGGRLPEISDIGFALRLSDQDVSETVKSLVACGLIDETGNGLIPHNWTLRQYKSDVSTERVKRFRNGPETPKKQKLKRSASVSVSVSVSESVSEKEVEAQFDKFYAAYPRQQGRAQALRAFRSALGKASAAEIMAGLARYVLTKPDYQDWAMPATWLNGERWNDVPHAAPKPATPSPKFGPKPLNLDVEAKRWKSRAALYLEKGTWMDMWGPKPGEAGCGCPPELLQRSA